MVGQVGFGVHCTSMDGELDPLFLTYFLSLPCLSGRLPVIQLQELLLRVGLAVDGAFHSVEP